MRRVALSSALLLAGCDDQPSVTIDVTTGHESDAFQKPPIVTAVTVNLHDAADAVIKSAASAPGGSFDLGELPLDQLVSVTVSGRDATGAERVSGRSLAVVLGGLASQALPVFASRLGEWSRPPDGLPFGRENALAGLVGERFLILAGGSALDGAAEAEPAFYDLLALGGAIGAAPLPRSPRALLVSSDGTAVLLIDDDGASFLELDSGNVATLELPVGLASYGELAGGLTVPAGGGQSYLVGGARRDQSSDAVLRVSADRTVNLARLAAARQGAAAAWLEGAGLLVAGGHAEAPGVELLLDTGMKGATLPFPADPTVGAAMAARASGGAVLFGGLAGEAEAPIRLIDPACASDCAPEALPITIGTPLDACRVFPLGGDRYLLAGEASDGTRTFLIDLAAQSADELPLREARRGAALSATPTGAFALMGGVHDDDTTALTVELFRP